MIDVSEAVIGADLAQAFTIIRSAGGFVNGVWQTQQTELPAQGTISNASDSDLEMKPEGDVPRGAKVFHTDQQILTTQEAPTSPTAGTGYSSDILVIDNGDQYRVLTVTRVPGSGFYRAVATRLSTGA